MFDIVKIVHLVLEIGLRLTLFSTGDTFDPVYQKRYYDEWTQKSYKSNYEYKINELVPTFIEIEEE